MVAARGVPWRGARGFARIWSARITSAHTEKNYLSPSWAKINTVDVDNGASWAGMSHNRQLPCLIWRLIDRLSCGFDLILPDLHQKITSQHVLRAPDVTFPPLFLLFFFTLCLSLARTRRYALCISDGQVTRVQKKWKKGVGKVVSQWEMTPSNTDTHSQQRTSHSHAHMLTLNTQSHTYSGKRRREERVRGCKRSSVLCNGGEEWVCSVRPGRHNGFVSCLI